MHINPNKMRVIKVFHKAYTRSPEVLRSNIRIKPSKWISPNLKSIVLRDSKGMHHFPRDTDCTLEELHLKTVNLVEVDPELKAMKNV